MNASPIEQEESTLSAYEYTVFFLCFVLFYFFLFGVSAFEK